MQLVQKYGPYALIILSIWLIYGSTLRHGFAGDDVIVITQNERVQQGLSDIPLLFQNIKSDQTQHRYGYRPITLLTFAAEVEFFGMDPFWHHLTNLLLYSMLCVLIYHLLLTLFPAVGSLWALFTVLIFIAHPLHVEVVANVKSRDEILAMLFGVLFLLSLYRWLEKASAGVFILAMLFGVLGFLSKENAIGYVLVGGLMPWLKPGDNLTRLRRLTPTVFTFILLVGIYFASQYNLESNSMLLYDQGRYHEDRFAANPLVDEGLAIRMMNVFFVILISIKLFLLPYPLVHDYGFDYISVVRDFLDYRWILGGLVCAALIWFGYRLRKQHPMILFGIGFFLLTLAIFLHVPIPGADFFGERFLFGPLLGLSMVTVSLVFMLPKRIGVFVLITALEPLGVLSNQRAADWASTLTLLQADEPYLKDCARFQYNYANHLHVEYYQASPKAQEKLRKQLISRYERAIAITDRVPIAYLDLGAAYMEFGEKEKAKLVFEQCADKFGHLSVPHFQLGKYYMSQNSFSMARHSFELALENGASNPNAYYMMAICDIKLGDLKRARTTLISGREYGESQEQYKALMDQLGIR